MGEITTALVGLAGVLVGAGVVPLNQWLQDRRARRETYAHTLAELQEAITDLITHVIAIQYRQYGSYARSDSGARWPEITPEEQARGFLTQARADMLKTRIHERDLRADIDELLLKAGSITAATSREESLTAQQPVRELFPEVVRQIGELIVIYRRIGS
jgi:hypothetical protein